MEEPDQSFEAVRKSDNVHHLRWILIMFTFVQLILGMVRVINEHRIDNTEFIFYGVCLCLTIALAVVVSMGKDKFLQISMFLTMFLAAIYSWYGSLIHFGEEVYILVLILIGVFIVDAEGFRRSSALSGVVYIYTVITQQKIGFIPNGNLLVSVTIIVAFWIFTEQRHKRELKYFSNHSELKTQHEILETEIAYRDALTEKLMESEHRFRVFMNHVPVALIVLDDRKITYANKSAMALTGYDRNELEAIDWMDLIDYDDAKMLDSRLSNASWETGELRDYNVKIIHKSNKPIWSRLVVTDLKYEFKNVKLVSGYDITNQKHYETQLNRLVRMKEDMLLLTQSILGIDDLGILFDIILDGAIDSVEMADRGSILLVGEDGLLKAEAYRGYSADQMEELKIPVEETFLYLKTRGQLRTTEIINDITRLDNVKLFGQHKEVMRPVRSTIGTPIYFQDNLYGMVYLDSPIKNAFNEEDFMMVDFLRTQIEMAVNKQALQNEAIYLSRYDKLTGIFNRRWFEEYYQTMEMKARRYEDEFALVMFDLNGLKQINDAYGHLEGDAMIKGFTDRLKNLTRSSDILARFGGDEFVGIFHEIDSVNLKKRMENFMQDFIHNPIITEENEIYCRFSYGAAYFQRDSDDYETLVKIADKRMYQLKASQEKTHTVKRDI